ncbi:FAD/NAD(P)-binding domain-containing protein [Wilcoxina mikolae CBS 423.85]|nr:FAD/NAD(P)-binding domain-containing protein [Wilcoxina mikolae CBS 423.85]
MADNLTPQQISAILAIAETFVPALTPDETAAAQQQIHSFAAPPSAPSSVINEYLMTSSALSPEFAENMLSRIPPRVLSSLGGFLNLMHNGGFVAFFFTWSFSPFIHLPRKQRENILKGWRDSWFPSSRALFSSLKRLVLITYLKAPPKALGYPLHKDVRPSSRPDVHSFSFHSFSGAAEAMDVDIVIIGSGAGGGVVAAKLAGLGKKVVVVEKGECIPVEQMPVEQLEHERLYDGAAGAFVTADGKGTILAGSNWGGSTTVNFLGSLELSDDVRNEWSEVHGLSFASTEKFQACYDRCKAMMGVSTNAIEHSSNNQVLIDGARRCGFECNDIPQNTAGKKHTACGSFCGYGCCIGGKQGTAVTWLAEAEKKGAVCIKECRVNEITFEENKATGLRATLSGGKELTIRAKTVVVSAGAIRTPCLLMNSGVEHPALGKNLRVHPAAFCVGFLNKRQTKAWEGSMMTAMVTKHTTTTNTPYWAKLINIPVNTGTTGFQLPWYSAAHWKANILRLEKSVWTCIITRDRDSGSVVADEAGEPVITYDLSTFDHANILDGIIAAIKVQVAGGCDEVQPILDGGETMVESYVPDPQTPLDERTKDPRFERYLEMVRRTAIKRKRGNWTSAHPQGSCKMGADGETAVVDCRGRVRGYQGLYVADASLCPSATGVNPMLTTMALAEWVAGRIAEDIE